MVSHHPDPPRRSALAYGSRSTAAAETTSTGSYTTSGDATHGDHGHAVRPLELFFDLVFVFGFTQVTTVLFGVTLHRRTRPAHPAEETP